jgi:hypothetical protein
LQNERQKTSIVGDLGPVRLRRSYSPLENCSYWERAWANGLVEAADAQVAKIGAGRELRGAPREEASALEKALRSVMAKVLVNEWN